MALRDRIKYLRKEQHELLHLADRVEKLLESASKNDFAEHQKSLSELILLEPGFAGIVDHCHPENRIVESTYREYLQPDECARIVTEHEQIIRAVTNFGEELKFATADRTEAMILPGMDVVNQLRSHIAYEQKLLDRIVQTSKMQKKEATKKQPEQKILRTTRKHASRRKLPAKTHLSYTLEPHPEL